MKLWLSKFSQFVKKVSQDVWRAFNNAESWEEFKEKAEKSYRNNVKQFLGRKALKAHIITIALMPVLLFGYTQIKDDFRLLKNLHFAISSDFVIEDKMKKQDDKYQKLKEQNIHIQGEYEQLQKNYDKTVELQKEQFENYQDQLQAYLLELQKQKETASH